MGSGERLEAVRSHCGWHNFSNELMLFHGAIKQFLQEPAINLERMKQEALSMKVFIETVINIEEPKEEGEQR